MKTTLAGPAVFLFSALMSVSVYGENECEKKDDKTRSDGKECARVEPAAVEGAKKKPPPQMNEPEQKALTVKELAEKRAREYEQWERENKVPNAQID
jgi:hypothetical protein